MPRRAVPWLLAMVAVTALAVFAVLTVAVTNSASLGLDARAFEIADNLRAPWLDAATRLVTKLGLIAIVGSAVLLGAALLITRRHLARAAALVIGAAIAWISAWIVKAAVARPRPPDPLVHASGMSYPSAHAVNSVGWLALAIALTIAIPTKRRQIFAISAGAVLAALVGLSRIYLRAHYASDVIAGEALAVATYSLATLAAILWHARRGSVVDAHGGPPPIGVA
jgi:undecaprenyl-diphosphatase